MPAALPRTAGAITSRYVADHDQIERAFRAFRDQRARLSLRFDRETREVTARLLDVVDGHLVLDDIRPRDTLRLLNADRHFSLTGRAEGLYVYAEDLRVAEATSERGVPYFRVVLPDRILHQQRRRAARYRLPDRVGDLGTLVRLHRGGRALEGQIVDVSIGGCRAAFPSPVSPAFKIDETIDRCEISVSNVLAITALGSIRHHGVDAGSGRTVCGIEFVRMGVMDRRRLESFIQALARTATPS
jgi:c-di-GMP-binding flagellar brake protein YcgR